MRKLALIFPLVLLFVGCGTEADRMVDDYESDRFYQELADHTNGRSAAFGRDMEHIRRTIDRHLLNYDWDDPYLNPAGGSEGGVFNVIGFATSLVTDSITYINWGISKIF